MTAVTMGAWRVCNPANFKINFLKNMKDRRQFKMSEKKPLEQTLSEFKEKFPDLYGATYQQGEKAGKAAALQMGSDLKNLCSQPENTLEKTTASRTGETSEQAVEAQAKIDWDADPALRAEFRSNFAGFVAYCKADAAGLVRIAEGVVIR